MQHRGRCRPLLSAFLTASLLPPLPLSRTARCTTTDTMHITPDEYQKLPASVQKKYFSSVERLRILQQTASDPRTTHAPPAPSPSSSFDATTRPRTSPSIRAPSIRASRKSSIAPIVEDVTEDQALRFLALPDKVKRSHFSEEELLLLTESAQRTLGLRGQSNLPRWPHDLRSMSIASSSSQKSTGLEEEADWCDVETTSVRSADLAASEPQSNETWPHLNTIACSAYATASSSTVDVSWTPSSRKSFTKKRALSLTPLPLPPPTLLPPMPPLPQSNPLRSARSSQTETPSHSRTQFYKDSQARSKLRAFLASPEKFDEALEFGFPVELPEKQQQHIVHEPSPAMEQFYYEENLDEEDLSNDSSVASPMTVDSFSSSETSHEFPDSGVALKSKSSFRSFTPDLDGREMTLRLTLTRRELRATEDQLYAVQRTQVSGVDVETVDPLALRTLEFCDDPSGKQGAFAINDQGARRGLKKIWSNPRLFLYTSLTAGSSHIITATSRMETILKANKIPFQAIDIATDEKARRLWQRRAGKRKIPGLVKEGYIVGDLTEVEEWNEFGELRENIGPVPANNKAPPGGLVGVQTAPPLNHNVSVPAAASSNVKPSPPPAVSRAQGIALPGAAEIAARKKKSSPPLQAKIVETRAAATTEPVPEAGKAKEAPISHPAIDHLSAPASRIQSGTATPVEGEERKESDAGSPAQEPADAAAVTEKHRGSEVVEASADDIKKIESEISITEGKEEEQKEENDAVEDVTADAQALTVDDKPTNEEHPALKEEKIPEEKSAEETSAKDENKPSEEKSATEEEVCDRGEVREKEGARVS
ncbi:hypothetical protein BST61_g9039 [Cercospora zeina]